MKVTMSLVMCFRELVLKDKTCSDLTWQRCSMQVRLSSMPTILWPATVLYAFRHCKYHGNITCINRTRQYKR